MPIPFEAVRVLAKTEIARFKEGKNTLVVAAKRGAKGASEFDPLSSNKQDLHNLQASKLTQRLGSDEWIKGLERKGYNPDEVIGFAHFSEEGGKLKPAMAYVHGDFRRQGLASSMYDTARSGSTSELASGLQRPEGKAFRKAYDRKLGDVLKGQRGAAQIDPVTVAKTVNAVPVGPIFNTLKTQEGQIPFEKVKRLVTPERRIMNFLSMKPQLEALSNVVPTVRSEIAGGRQDIDQARQPWETFLGAARVGLSPLTATIRPLLAEPVGMAAQALGASEKQRQMAELAAEIAGNVAVPGLGFPRISRALR